VRTQVSVHVTLYKAAKAAWPRWCAGVKKLPWWGGSKRDIRYLDWLGILLDFALIVLLTLGHPTGLVADDWWIRVEEIDSQTGLVVHRGRYRNPNYLYSFTIPEGLVCLSDPAPAPHHGCGIDLSEHPRAYIWADGSYNALDRVSPDDALRDAFDSLMKEGMEIVVLERRATPLGGLPAERLVVRYKHRDEKESTVKAIVMALRNVQKWGDMIYTLGLISPPFRFEQDKAVFEAILASWKNESP